MFMDLSIIIVNYNTKQLTLNTIHSVFASSTLFRYEIILVDNHSSDGTVEEVSKAFPEVRTISNRHNLGFSKANNLGMQIAQGRYILLLNSDTVIMPDTLDTMITFMDEHPKVGASGCKLLLADGSLDKTCKRGFPTPLNALYYLSGISRLFPRNPQFNQYQMSHIDPDQETQIDCLVGAFMMVRRETIAQVGMLDEVFFMYGEDIDWCYRIKEAGWDIYYYPKTHIIHYKGASSKQKPVKIIYEFHRAMILFHRKHYQDKYNGLINLLVYSGIYLKMSMEIMYNWFRYKLLRLERGS